MKKRSVFLLIISAAGLLLGGCSVVEGLSKAKEVARQGYYKGKELAKELFEGTTPENTPTQAEYVLSYHN